MHLKIKKIYFIKSILGISNITCIDRNTKEIRIVVMRVIVLIMVIMLIMIMAMVVIGNECMDGNDIDCGDNNDDNDDEYKPLSVS